MGLPPEQEQELRELNERAAWLDAEIQKLFMERHRVFKRTEDLNMVRLEGLQSERMKVAPTTSTMDLEVLADWLTIQVQRLEEENLGRTDKGALRFIEDGFGWTTSWVREAIVSPDAKVFTIHGPEGWAELCRKFPLDVTASKGVDWHQPPDIHTGG